MLITNRRLSPEEKKLLELVRALDGSGRQTVLAFAEFLASREETVTSPEPESLQPLDIPRPEGETVVAAIKRLSKTYPMIEKDQMFHETSDLMTAHVLQGRSAPEVIDDLEQLFRRRYEELISARGAAE